MSCPPSPTLSATSTEFVYVPEPTCHHAHRGHDDRARSSTTDTGTTSISPEVQAFIQSEIKKGIAAGRSQLHSDLLKDVRAYIDEEFEEITSETTSKITESSDSSMYEDLAELQDRLERLDADLTHECDVRAELAATFSDFQFRLNAELPRLLTLSLFSELRDEVLREVRVSLAAGRETARMQHAQTREELRVSLAQELMRTYNSRLGQHCRKLDAELIAYTAQLREEFDVFKQELRGDMVKKLEALEHSAATASRRISRLRRTQRRVSAVTERVVCGTEWEEKMREVWAETMERERDQNEEAWSWLDTVPKKSDAPASAPAAAVAKGKGTSETNKRKLAPWTQILSSASTKTFNFTNLSTIADTTVPAIPPASSVTSTNSADSATTRTAPSVAFGTQTGDSPRSVIAVEMKGVTEETEEEDEDEDEGEEEVELVTETTEEEVGNCIPEPLVTARGLLCPFLGCTVTMPDFGQMALHVATHSSAS